MQERFDWSGARDPGTGLWWQEGPGHTAPTAGLPRVRSGCAAAARLWTAAELGQWREAGGSRVLAALRSLQVTDGGPRHGCLRWYAEDPAPVDTNAAFFCALSLIPLHRIHLDLLDGPDRLVLRELLEGLKAWFDRAVAEGAVWYPNKYLGDLVCAWLIGELLERPDPDGALADAMLATADLWLSDGWGWGEHLSDIYAGVCLRELALLLLLARRLPEAVHARYRDLLAGLLAIEDRFGGLPRVPALRSYAMRESPAARPFRSLIRPDLAAPGSIMGPTPDLGPLFHRLGWHRLAPAPLPAARDIRVPCHRGAEAVARVEPDIRIGSVSRFPVMPSAEAPTWGLAWQCFPVALWRNAGDGWGFLQWETEEDGAVRAIPALDRRAILGGNGLSAAVTPPLVGRTVCFQRGGRVAALRWMSPIPARWGRLTDRFRLLGKPESADVARAADDRAGALRLVYPGRVVSVQYIDLCGDGPLPEWRPGPPGEPSDWAVDWPAARLRGRNACGGLWLFDIGGAAVADCRIEPEAGSRDGAWRAREERARVVSWEWGGEVWRVCVDPMQPGLGRLG